MFGKEKKQEAQSQTQNVSHIILTTAHEIPSRRYEIVDVVGATTGANFTKGFATLKDEVRKLAQEAGADAVIAFHLSNDGMLASSGNNLIAYGTAIKFTD